MPIQTTNNSLRISLEHFSLVPGKFRSNTLGQGRWTQKGLTWQEVVWATHFHSRLIWLQYSNTSTKKKGTEVWPCTTLVWSHSGSSSCLQGPSGQSRFGGTSLALNSSTVILHSFIDSILDWVIDLPKAKEAQARLFCFTSFTMLL